MGFLYAEKCPVLHRETRSKIYGWLLTYSKGEYSTYFKNMIYYNYMFTRGCKYMYTLLSKTSLYGVSFFLHKESPPKWIGECFIIWIISSNGNLNRIIEHQTNNYTFINFSMQHRVNVRRVICNYWLNDWFEVKVLLLKYKY